MIPFYGVFDWTGSGGHRRDEGLRDDGRRGWSSNARMPTRRDVYEAASPIFRVHPGAPPALVIHGDLDSLAPVSEARTFVEKLRATSAKPVVYVELKGAHHAFEIFNSIRAMHVIAGVDLYLAWLLKAEPAAHVQAQHAAARGDTDAPGDAAIDQRSTARTVHQPAPPARAAPGRS